MNATDPLGLEVYYNSGGGDHSDLVVPDSSSRTGYSAISFGPGEGRGWETPVESALAPGKLSIFQGDPNHPSNVRLNTTAAEEKAILQAARGLHGNEPRYNVVAFNCADMIRYILQ